MITEDIGQHLHIQILIWKNTCAMLMQDVLLKGVQDMFNGIRPVIVLKSKVQLIKNVDDTGFEYFEMIDADQNKVRVIMKGCST